MSVTDSGKRQPSLSAATARTPKPSSAQSTLPIPSTSVSIVLSTPVCNLRGYIEAIIGDGRICLLMRVK